MKILKTNLREHKDTHTQVNISIEHLYIISIFLIMNPQNSEGLKYLKKNEETKLFIITKNRFESWTGLLIKTFIFLIQLTAAAAAVQGQWVWYRTILFL